MKWSEKSNHFIKSTEENSKRHTRDIHLSARKKNTSQSSNVIRRNSGRCILFARITAIPRGRLFDNSRRVKSVSYRMIQIAIPRHDHPFGFLTSNWGSFECRGSELAEAAVPTRRRVPLAAKYYIENFSQAPGRNLFSGVVLSRVSCSPHILIKCVTRWVGW